MKKTTGNSRRVLTDNELTTCNGGATQLGPPNAGLADIGEFAVDLQGSQHGQE